MGFVKVLLYAITKIRQYVEVFGTPTIPSPLTNYEVRLKIKDYIRQGVPVVFTQFEQQELSDTYLIRVVGEENWRLDGQTFLFGHLFNRRTRTVKPLYINEYSKFTAYPAESLVSSFDYKVFLELADILSWTNKNDYNEDYIVLKPDYQVERYFKLVYRTEVKLGVVSAEGNVEKIRFYSLPYFQTLDTNYRERQTLYYGIDEVPTTYESLWKAWTYYRHFRYTTQLHPHH